MSENNQDEKEERVRGIFTLTGVKYQSKIKIHHIKNEVLKHNEYVGDTLVEQFNITKGVIGEIYRCNITDIYIMAYKKLPLFYVNVINERPMRKVLLLVPLLAFLLGGCVKEETTIIQPVVQPVQSQYKCNCAKTCPNMSCDEAYYQLNVCGCYQRDADGDGIPCEAQCQ